MAGDSTGEFDLADYLLIGWRFYWLLEWAGGLRQFDSSVGYSLMAEDAFLADSVLLTDVLVAGIDCNQ